MHRLKVCEPSISPIARGSFAMLPSQSPFLRAMRTQIWSIGPISASRPDLKDCHLCRCLQAEQRKALDRSQFRGGASRHLTPISEKCSRSAIKVFPSLCLMRVCESSSVDRVPCPLGGEDFHRIEGGRQVKVPACVRAPRHARIC